MFLFKNSLKEEAGKMSWNRDKACEEKGVKNGSVVVVGSNVCEVVQTNHENSGVVHSGQEKAEKYLNSSPSDSVLVKTLGGEGKFMYVHPVHIKK